MPAILTTNSATLHRLTHDTLDSCKTPPATTHILTISSHPINGYLAVNCPTILFSLASTRAHAAFYGCLLASVQRLYYLLVPTREESLYAYCSGHRRVGTLITRTRFYRMCWSRGSERTRTLYRSNDNFEAASHILFVLRRP
jgi:hypothetical protein